MISCFCAASTGDVTMTTVTFCLSLLPVGGLKQCALVGLLHMPLTRRGSQPPPRLVVVEALDLVSLGVLRQAEALLLQSAVPGCARSAGDI
jgi:hypothetical protein